MPEQKNALPAAPDVTLLKGLEPMARSHNKTGRSRSRHGKHVRLYQWLLNTPAYRALTVGARAALVEFYALFNGTNNGDLFLSQRELAKRLNVTKDTAAKYINELVEKGFIKVQQKGAFDWKSGHATTWILTEHEGAHRRGQSKQADPRGRGHSGQCA